MTCQLLRSHWFYPLAALVVATDCLVAWQSRVDMRPMLEVALLADLALLMPLLYWLCYRRHGKHSVVRALALACLGIWIALAMVPEEQSSVVHRLAPLRYVGMAVVAWFEIRILVAVYRSVFKSQSMERAAAGMPAWLVKLLAWEARLWLRVWTAIKRLLGKS